MRGISRVAVQLLRAEVKRYQRRFEALPLIEAARRWFHQLASYDLLLVFNSYLRSKPNHCRVISR